MSERFLDNLLTKLVIPVPKRYPCYVGGRESRASTQINRRACQGHVNDDLTTRLADSLFAVRGLTVKKVFWQRAAYIP
jgi:hypothetical protein